jgi:hypothetical protein
MLSNVTANTDRLDAQIKQVEAQQNQLTHSMEEIWKSLRIARSLFSSDVALQKNLPVAIHIPNLDADCHHKHPVCVCADVLRK